MEGSLWVRKARGRLLFTWNQRYIVLSKRDGVLKEYKLTSGTLTRPKQRSRSSSGMTLYSQYRIRPFHRNSVDNNKPPVKPVPFRKAGKQFAFQVEAYPIHTSETPLKLIYACKTKELMDLWIATITFFAQQISTAHLHSLSDWTEEDDDSSLYQSLAEDLLTEVHISSDEEMERIIRALSHKETDMTRMACVELQEDMPIDSTYLTAGACLVGVNGMRITSFASYSEVLTCLRSHSLPQLTLTFATFPSKRDTLVIDGQQYTGVLSRNKLFCKAQSKSTHSQLFDLSFLTPDSVLPSSTSSFVLVYDAPITFTTPSTSDRDDWITSLQTSLYLPQINTSLPSEISLSSLLDESARHIRHDSSLLDLDLHPSDNSPSSSSDEMQGSEVGGLLLFLQKEGRFIEALQLLVRYTDLRPEYWPPAFAWALDSISEDEIRKWSRREIPHSDRVQMDKDIPRTSRWLQGSHEAPDLSPEATRKRLEALEVVLNAFVAQTVDKLQIDVKEEGQWELKTRVYMQGMNGIAYLLLYAFDDAIEPTFNFFAGIVRHILPQVFSANRPQDTQPSDLFTSLSDVGSVLEDVVQVQLPVFSETLLEAGLPVCMLAHKWFPTLFSDVCFTAAHAQLRFDTLLLCWDVCFLMGLDGVFTVSIALCSLCEPTVVENAEKGAEKLGQRMAERLASVTCEELNTSVCEVLGMCEHPVLMRLRNTQRRCVLHKLRPDIVRDGKMAERRRLMQVTQVDPSDLDVRENEGVED